MEKKGVMGLPQMKGLDHICQGVKYKSEQRAITLHTSQTPSKTLCSLQCVKTVHPGKRQKAGSRSL